MQEDELSKKAGEPRDPTQVVPIQVRMRESLRVQIEQAAQETGESMNSEIVRRLEQSFEIGGLQGHGWLSVTLQAIGFDALRLEKITGKPFQQDRPSTIALAKLASENFLFGGAPRPNAEALRAVTDKFNALESAADRKIAFLQEMGALGRGNVLPMFVNTSRIRPELQHASDLIHRKNYYLTADLSGSTSDWEITCRGERLSAQGLSQVEGALIDLVQINDDINAVLEEFRAVDMGEQAAKAEALLLNGMLQRTEPTILAVNRDDADGPAL